MKKTQIDFLSRIFPYFQTSKIIRIAVFSILAFVFWLEVFTPKGFAHGMLYLPLCMAAALFRSRTLFIGFTSTAAALIALGFFISSDTAASFPLQFLVLNRLISAGILIITAGLSWKVSTFLESQERTSRELEHALITLSERERYFRGLLYSIHEDIIVIDKDYQIIDVNNTFVQTVNMSRDEVIGRKCYEISHGYLSPCHDHGETCMMKEVFSDGTSKSCIHTHNPADRKPVHVDILLSPVFNKTGQVTHVVESIRDITDRITWEQEKDRQGTLLQMAGRVAKFGGWSLDLEQNYVLWSDEVAAILGTSPGYRPTKEEAFGFYAPEYQQLIRSRFAQCIEHGSSFDEELQIIAQSGERVWVRVVGVPISDRQGRIVGVQGGFQDVSDRKQAEQVLQEQQAHFEALIEGSPIPIFVQTDYQFAYLNQAACTLFGARDQSELYGTPVMERFHPSYRDEINDRIQRLNRKGEEVPEIEEIFLRLDGREVQVEVSAVPISFKGKNGALVFARDISERKKAHREQEELRKQLVQAQKMESVGRLAGGVAHDYNNMLSVIIGYSELALQRLKPDDPVKHDLEEIYHAAYRSAQITQQLLAFARKQTIAPQVIDVNKRIDGTMNMLKRAVGEEISLHWEPKEGLWPILIDPVQLDQVLMNLVLNARDAMNTSGTITIETDTASVDEQCSSGHLAFLPGEYVIIQISDDGEGMDKNIQESIFDPFFTTKGDKEGSGLGLPMVYGIVRQNKGWTHVYSEPGEGTTVKLYFPRYQGETPKKETPSQKQIPQKGEKTVLVVEDDQAILQLTATLLDKLGYQVLRADSPARAVHIAEQQQGRIDVLVTDVVMPGMTGKELSEALQENCPQLKTLYMSGYTANVITHRGVLDEGVHFLQKPFSLKELSEKLDELISFDKQ